MASQFGADFLTAFGTSINPQAGALLQRRRELQLDRAEKENAQARLQALIGTAGTPAVPFNPEASPLLPVDAIPGTGFAGQAGLESAQVEMLKNLAGASPDLVSEAISEQIFSGGGGDFKNVRIDDFGNAFGVKNGTFQQIPSSDPSHPFTKFKTVQGTDPGGIPTTELVNPSALQIKDGRITIGKKTPLPTQGEATKIAQTQSSVQIIGDLRKLMQGKNAPDVGSLGSFVNEMKAGTGFMGVLTRAMTDPLTPKQAQLISKSEALSNQIIQAMRGAQVGPAEQERFERQLPRPGQPRVLFMENLEQSEKNLKFLNNEVRRLRKFGTPTINTIPPLPSGFTVTP